MTLASKTNKKNTTNNVDYNRQKIGIKNKNIDELNLLFDKLDKNLDKMAKTSGLNVDELIDALDPTKPFPF